MKEKEGAMAGLTAEQFHQEMEKFYKRLNDFRAEIEKHRRETALDIERLQQETTHSIERLRQETAHNIHQHRNETSSGFGQVLDTIQAFQDGQRDELVGINGRLRDHGERIARLERQSLPNHQAGAPA